MLKRFTHSLVTAVALLFMLTATSALGSQGVRPATVHAAHGLVRHHSKARVSHRSKAARRRARRRHEAAIRAANARRISRKHPVWPVVPVTPIEPTPPTNPTPPTEPTEPVVPVTLAPTVTAMPSIGGTTSQGQTLTATTGAWTGGPTGYAYQWKDCNSSGGGCAGISGSSASSYKLTAGDVGKKMSVTVTATNAGGSTSASSAPTATVAAVAPPPPAPPVARFTYSPSAPVTGQAVTFDGSSSSCADGPCTYEWSDDGGLTQPLTVLWPLGGGQTLQFTFSGVGTKYVRLILTDAAGQTASVEHNVAVAEVTPPPPSAPVNTAPPVLGGGAAEVGQTLSASTGSWTGGPTSYAYQWQACNTAGESCANIGAATSSSYTAAASDVGHTLRVIVTASNSGGSTPAASAATTPVLAESPPPPPPPPPSAPTNTVLPAVSGPAVEGETLKVSNGTWTGTPVSYAYQWQDCNTAGASCVNVNGANSSSHPLSANDVGHTLRAVVSASNSGGSTAASSAQSATVAAAVVGGGPEEPNLTAKECFSNPETEGTARIEACGYPGAGNVGLEKGALEKGLTAASGTVRLTGEEHYENKRLTGTIVIAWNAKNVVIKNDEIFDTGSCPSPQFSLNYGCVGNAIEFERRGAGSGEEINEAAKGTRIAHVKVGGTEKHGPNTVQTCIDARWNSPYVAEYVNAEHCSGFKLNAGGELNHVYCPSNYEIGGEHYECVTDEGNKLNATTLHTPLIIKNSTIFQPPIKQSVESSGLTAAIFQQSIYGSIQETILEKDLIAGGNFSVYFGEEAGETYKLTGPDTVRYNRFARCTTGKCPDAHGYFEEFGQYHVASFYNESKMTWNHNFVDNNLEECKLGVGLCY